LSSACTAVRATWTANTVTNFHDICYSRKRSLGVRENIVTENEYVVEEDRRTERASAECERADREKCGEVRTFTELFAINAGHFCFSLHFIDTSSERHPKYKMGRPILRRTSDGIGRHRISHDTTEGIGRGSDWV
jgi:hypothetical protein